MAAQGALEANVDQEREIPVFTVMKNNAILKNIFVINSRSPISEACPQELSGPQDSSKTCQDFEHSLLVGRHPDCEIRLEHPSVSRFHLRIHSKPSSKRLSVTDLSSVHGTWISGKRMKPNIRVDVKEGDALKIGGSSRVYRLHWVPFCKAYDSNNPFVPPLNVPLPDEDMGEEIKRDENTLLFESGVQSVNSASPEDLLSIQFETSEEMKDVNTLSCKNEDEKSMELGCEFSLDFALEAMKALVSNYSEAPKEMENENALECKMEDEKTVDSPSEEASNDLDFNPSQEEVLSVAPLPEVMNALHMPLESRDMQFVKFAWEGSETLLLDRSPLLVTLGESKPSLAMQEVDYSHDMVAKNEGSPLMLRLDDNMSIPGDMEEDGEEENEYEKENENQQVVQKMESPRELAVHPTWEIEQEMENWDDAISESFADEIVHINENPMQEVDYSHDMVAKNEGSPLMLRLDDNMSISGDMEEDGEEENEYEKENENLQVEQKMESPRELAVHPTWEIEQEMENWDDAISESFADGIVHIIENPMQEIDYSRDMVAKNEGSPLMLRLDDNVNISGYMEEDGEEENEYEKENENLQVEQKMESPRELSVHPSWEIEQETENWDDAVSESFADGILHINENPMLPCDDEEMVAAWNFWTLSNQDLEDENATEIRKSLVEDPRDEVFSQESFPSEIQWDSFNTPALTSNLMDNLDDAISETFAEETLHINEHLIPPCDDEEMGAAWSFWSLNTQDLEDENQSSLVEDPSSGEIQSSIWSFWSGIPGAESVRLSSLSDAEMFQIETQSTNCSPCSEPSKERSPDRAAPVVWSERAQLASSLETRTNRTTQEEVDNNSVYNEVQMLNDRLGIYTVRDHLKEEFFTPEQEIFTQSTQGKSGILKDEHLPALEKLQLSTATTKSCIDSEESLSAYSNKENETPTTLQDKRSKPLLSANRMKLFMLSKEERTPLQTLFVDSPQMSTSEAHISCVSPSPYYNKENQTPKALQEQKSSQRSSAKCMKLFMQSKGEEQRMPLQTLFVDSPQMSVSEADISGASPSPYSNKENQTPKTLQKQKSAWHSSAKCMKLSIPSKGEQQRRTPLRNLIVDSPHEGTSNTHTSNGASPSACSIKENHKPKLLQEQKSPGHTKLLMLRKQTKMIQFQTLFGDSPPKNISNTISDVTARSRDSTTCKNSMDKNKHSKQQVKMWTILADVSSLLNKTSRKALQLLESIKKTQLIIPNAVMEELDVMKQQASFFRKNTDAFLASQWIEECMVRSKGWVKIQSSMVDDGRSTALASSTPFSYRAYGTLPKDVSPSTGDQVLDYAIYFRRTRDDGQLVLLSNDPTMKIKAMAEGLICETAEEFRESLVNPFSKRVLWVDSLPRGRTWSFLDDVILRNRFYPGATKAVENARGLKILLPNSMYQ